MRGEGETQRAIERYADMIKRLCIVHLSNRSDVEDVFQNVFLKYVKDATVFADGEHEKAWFIRVTVNACRDVQRSAAIRRALPIEETGICEKEELSDTEVIDAVRALPKKYRDPIYLHYYEGYDAQEIAGILKKNKNTVYTCLKRGRELLKKTLGGEDLGGTDQKRL